MRKTRENNLALIMFESVSHSNFAVTASSPHSAILYSKKLCNSEIGGALSSNDVSESPPVFIQESVLSAIPRDGRAKLHIKGIPLLPVNRFGECRLQTT